MLRRVVAAGTTIFLVTGMLALAATPAAAAWTLDNQLDSPVGARISTAKPPAAVIISERLARIGRDGSVPVKAWARCNPGLQAFEFDASVLQGSTFGSTTLIGPPDVVVCDGLWHAIVVKVLPESGSFRFGRATVDVFLGVFDPSDGDLEARDSATVLLFSAHHHS